MATAGSAPADPWQVMFPLDEARQATTFLVDTWYRITKEFPTHLEPKLLEPALTEKFWWYLDQHSVPEGRLTGRWDYERHRLELDSSTKRFVKRIRLDITYFSNAGPERLDLVYEFKKLSPEAKSRSKYRGKEGLGRFVDGFYAKNQPFAAMVGMTLKDRDDCVSAIAADLAKSAIQAPLAMVAGSSGNHVFRPSQLFGGHADFDTEHVRPADQAWNGGNTRVAHIFLPLPGCT